MTLEEARLRANVKAKADRLHELGYSADVPRLGIVDVFTPRGGSVRIDLEARRCNCSGFGKWGFCSHFWGWQGLLERRAA